VKRNSLGSIQGFNFEEEEGNFGLERATVEDKVIVVPIELEHAMDTSQMLEYYVFIQS
jgi:hypothetical protein